MFATHKLVAMLATLAFVIPGVASAQLTAQQERMKTCNAEASSKELKGDDRQAFMSRCLKGEGQEKKLTAQQEKMKACNIEASQKQLKGDARRQFMSECLRKDGGEDLTVQQEKMATCNRQASDEHLKGDERRAYMSDCLRADKAGSHPAAAGGTRK